SGRSIWTCCKCPRCGCKRGASRGLWEKRRAGATSYASRGQEAGRAARIESGSFSSQRGDALTTNKPKKFRRELVEAVGIEPTSGNPQPQASTSIADLLYCFSPRGTPIGRITARPASKVSPLP